MRSLVGVLVATLVFVVAGCPQFRSDDFVIDLDAAPSDVYATESSAGHRGGASGSSSGSSASGSGAKSGSGSGETRVDAAVSGEDSSMPTTPDDSSITEAGLSDEADDGGVTDASDASDTSDACTPVLHHDGNGPSSWSTCYPLATYNALSATDACNAYFSQFYQPGEWSACALASCPNAALPSAEMVCANILGADGGATNQICWVYSGMLMNGHGPGSSCTSLDPCGGTCASDSQWQ